MIQIIKFLRMFITFLVAIFIMSVLVDVFLYWSKLSIAEVVSSNFKSIGFKIVASLIVTAYLFYKERKEGK